MKNYAEFKNDLKKLISFNSILSDAKEGMPFGENCYLALECFLDIAKRLGFDTINYDGYVAEVSFGDGEEVGIIGHLDIVPATNGWSSDPFTLTEKDGKLIGRGMVDDKMPMLLCLYALKEVKDSGIKFNRKIRLFAGTNEETGWKDVAYLQTKTTLPEYGFSPDGNFPLSYAEKGMYYFILHLPKFELFENLSGGTAVNSVCDLAFINQKTEIDENLLKKYDLTKDGNKIISKGVAAHGSSPQKGVNAFKNLFLYMREVGENLGNLPEILFFDKLGVFNFTNEQGATTFSPNLIKPTENGCGLYCDLRIPAPLTIENITPTLNKFGVPFSIIEKHPPVMVEKDGWFVSALKKSYEDATGKDGTPISMGGSTFARAFRKGCAFGPDDGIHAGGCHKTDEYIEEEYLLSCYEIYKNTIVNLVK